MRNVGTVPRTLGFKRKPVQEIARLLDVLNEHEPHAHSLPAWDSIVETLKADLAHMQTLQVDCREPFDELTVGATDVADAKGTPLSSRWEPPFDPPATLAGSFAAQQDYFFARRGLWMLWQANAAHLIHQCVNRSADDDNRCAEAPYVFARETCDEKKCKMAALRHARRYESFRLSAERRINADGPESLTEDDLLEPGDDTLPLRNRA